MKKTLIALAALAATGAFAQSTVTIDGIADVGLQSINYKGTTITDINNKGSATSQINFRGSEDLGGGLKAEFRVESDWNMAVRAPGGGVAASTNTFNNGEARLGLAGGFGRVDMGAVNYNGLSTFLLGQPFGTAIGGGFGAVVGSGPTLGDVRADNSIKYTSPSFSGFNVTLYNVVKNTKGTLAAADVRADVSGTLGKTNHNGVTEIGLNYGNGPLNVSYSQNAYDSADVAAVGAGATAISRLLAANYALSNGLTVYLLNQRVNSGTGTTDSNATQISATYATGSHLILATIGNGSNNGTVSNGQTNTMFGLGYDYNFSKRTAAYARYENINDNMGVVANPGGIAADPSSTIRTRTAVGLRHNF